MTDRSTWRKRCRRSLGPMVTLAILTSSACNRAEPEKQNLQNDSAKQVASDQDPSKQNQTGPGSDFGANPGSNQMSMKQGMGPGGEILPPSASGAGLPVTSANPAGAIDNNPIRSGVQIEEGTSSFPAEVEETPAGSVAERLADRSFVKLVLPKGALSPDQLLAFLGDCDRAVQDLTLARQAKQLSEKEFLEQAKRLSTLKLEGSERMFADATSSVAQKKTAIAAQVESLSQLTGLGDVDAAQKLLKVAGELTKSADPQMAHQGRLVLIGFRLNQLVEGQLKDPQVIVDDVSTMLDKSEYRGLVELLALQQSLGVLNQLGYAEQANQVRQRVIKEYRNSTDRELAMRAWMMEVGNAAELRALHDSVQATLGGTEKDETQVAKQADALAAAFPSPNTLAYLTKMVVDLEYSGHVPASRELSSVVTKYKSQQPQGPMLSDIDRALDGHNRRLGSLGKPLVLDDLTGMDGAPFDWSVYRNKVVLVYFWASGEVPSLNLINQIKSLRQSFPESKLEIVGICTDDGRTITNAGKFIERQQLPWRNVRSSSPQAVGLESAAAKSLGVNAYAHFALLVDKKGIIRAVHPNFENIGTMIEELSN